MKYAVLVLALLLSAPTWAAPVKTHFMDHSNDLLIDAASAKAVMLEAIPDKVWKIYPAHKYVFLSQVQGGMNASHTCVVLARVIVLPLTATAKAVLFRPQETATAFDAKAGSNTEACKALAREKLKEATIAIVSAIVKN
jgi:hypothetical protein